jgi:signal transduction histidine kinase
MIYGNGSLFALVLVLIVDLSVLVWGMERADGQERILTGLKYLAEGNLQYKISTDRLRGEQKQMAEYINRIGSGLDAAVENSVKNERMKTELITNVSHDIKTPLTSIINYVDLLKRENFSDPKICGYLDILEAKAQRLKTLTEDVVEASKASTGNISLNLADLDFLELVQQVTGEFEERFREKKLDMVVRLEEKPVTIHADGQRLWRVLENVYGNTVKYAMEGTRVYAEVKLVGTRVEFSLKNISAQPLNISADELTERFIRGDVARNTEGSGLGLSIARDLTELQGGRFGLYLDGDLFKVIIAFPVVK